MCEAMFCGPEKINQFMYGCWRQIILFFAQLWPREKIVHTLHLCLSHWVAQANLKPSSFCLRLPNAGTTGVWRPFKVGILEGKMGQADKQESHFTRLCILRAQRGPHRMTAGQFPGFVKSSKPTLSVSGGLRGCWRFEGWQGRDQGDLPSRLLRWKHST